MSEGLGTKTSSTVVPQSSVWLGPTWVGTNVETATIKTLRAAQMHRFLPGDLVGNWMEVLAGK